MKLYYRLKCSEVECCRLPPAERVPSRRSTSFKLPPFSGGNFNCARSLSASTSALLTPGSNSKSSSCASESFSLPAPYFSIRSKRSLSSNTRFLYSANAAATTAAPDQPWRPCQSKFERLPLAQIRFTWLTQLFVRIFFPFFLY